MTLLTETYPRGKLAEGGSIRVIPLGVEQFKAFINEGLQHVQPCFAAWLSPLRLSHCSVNLQGG